MVVRGADKTAPAMDEQNQADLQDSFLNLLLDDGLQSALPRALKSTIAIMYVEGVSTRRVTKITGVLLEISDTWETGKTYLLLN
jgi:hypothetical protein